MPFPAHTSLFASQGVTLMGITHYSFSRLAEARGTEFGLSSFCVARKGGAKRGCLVKRVPVYDIFEVLTSTSLTVYSCLEIGNTMKFKTRIGCSLPEELVFHCLVHATTSPDARMIEPAFYKRWVPQAIPQGPHHELELLLEESSDLAAITLRHQSPPKLHIHKHPETGKSYVCWTGSLPTVDLAQELFKMWSVGTAYSLVSGKDFSELFTSNIPNFIDLMGIKYGIWVQSSEIDP